MRLSSHTNPVLVEFRYQSKHSRLDRSDLLDSFLDWLDHATADNFYCVTNGLTGPELAHARKVLMRLDLAALNV